MAYQSQLSLLKLGINWPLTGALIEQRRRWARLGWTLLPMLFAAGFMWQMGERLVMATRWQAPALRGAVELQKAEAAQARVRALQEERRRLERALEQDGPERLAEQYEWEAAVSPGQPWPPTSAQNTTVPVLPDSLRAILALEPSEREEWQRQAVAAYFRPYSRSYREGQAKITALRREEEGLR